MDFNIIKDDELSGNKAKIYSIRDKGKVQTYLEQFVSDNFEKYPQEVANILQKLHTMGHETGCEHNLFKHYEGKGGVTASFVLRMIAEDFAYTACILEKGLLSAVLEDGKI